MGAPKNLNIDWPQVLLAMKDGALVKDIARDWYNCTPEALVRRAKVELNSEAWDMYVKLGLRNAANSRKGKLDWKLIMHWLEAGHPLKEIAKYFNREPCNLTRRAHKELDPATFAVYKKLVQVNKRKGKAKCGTLRGYRSHVHYKTTPCQPCLDEHAKERKRIDANRRAKWAREHGTEQPETGTS